MGYKYPSDTRDLKWVDHESVNSVLQDTNKAQEAVI